MSECAILKQKADWRKQRRCDGARRAREAQGKVYWKVNRHPRLHDHHALFLVVSLLFDDFVAYPLSDSRLPHDGLLHPAFHSPSLQRPLHLPRIRLQMVLLPPLLLHRLDPARQRRSRRPLSHRRRAWKSQRNPSRRSLSPQTLGPAQDPRPPQIRRRRTALERSLPGHPGSSQGWWVHRHVIGVSSPLGVFRFHPRKRQRQPQNILLLLRRRRRIVANRQMDAPHNLPELIRRRRRQPAWYRLGHHPLFPFWPRLLLLQDYF